jgi:branched-chain amino acid transport system substrate-binding protein
MMEVTMPRIVVGTAAVAAALAVAVPSAGAQQPTVRIGLILPYSGQFADPAAQMENGLRLYVQQRGDTVAGRKIELIRKDTGGIAPDVAKRLAQELIVRDRVDLLAGFSLTPNAMAVADVSAQAKKFMVVMNAAASVVTTKSPYLVRTSFTLPQLNEPLGIWAYKSGIRKVYSMVSDFAAGHDAEAAFQGAFKAAGGQIIGSVRFPVANPDFSAFVQRAKDSDPEAIFVFVPGGAQSPALAKSLSDRGIDPRRIRIMSQMELTDEPALRNMGDTALGIVTSSHYDFSHRSARNDEFVRAYNAAYRRNPDFFSTGGYDGMHVVFQALQRTGGSADGDALIAAAKGLAWDSPRGPMSIDPATRDVVQTVYMRRVERVGGQLLNVEFDRIENVKDPVKARAAN